MAEQSLPFSAKRKNRGTPRGRGWTTEKRFWNLVDKDGTTMPHMDTQCWEWTGTISKYGYGEFPYKPIESKMCHRISFFLTFGKIPTPFCLHKCDNRKCVNPEHLYEGDTNQNMRDMVTRNRSKRGEDNPASVLTDAIVLECRRRVAAGESRNQLSKEFGCSSVSMDFAVRGKTWKHLPNAIPSHGPGA